MNPRKSLYNILIYQYILFFSYRESKECIFITLNILHLLSPLESGKYILTVADGTRKNWGGDKLIFFLSQVREVSTPLGNVLIGY